MDQTVKRRVTPTAVMDLCVGDAARGLPEHFQLEGASTADERVSVLKARNLQSGMLYDCTVYSKASFRDGTDMKDLLQARAAAQVRVCGKQPGASLC